MRASQYYLVTLKEAPQEAELPSHKLMLRAGLIRKLGSGLYTWMPLGLKVVRKVEAIVREEMNRAGALEMLAPPVQPAELWQETGRWDLYGPMMLRIKDRAEREFCYAPTAEEVLCDIIRKEIKSYRQLPVNLYQIQTKFRDEIRPRFGVMRAREFSMKDAYSFDADFAGLQKTYQAMYDAYARIFTRLGLKFRAVEADTGAIGGFASHEFQVLADAGEDAIAWCPQSDYAANVEQAEALAPAGPRPVPSEAMRKVPGLAGWRWATDAEIVAALGCRPGFLGPVGLPEDVPLIVDRSVAVMADFVCGANDADHHFTGANWGLDLPEPELVADIRNVVEGDPSPDGKGKLAIQRGIEVGHVFLLGDYYSRSMQATFLDEKGQPQLLQMGCYGIGITRIAGAAIEQNHDERGMIWPAPIAPFAVAICPIGYDRSPAVREAADALHRQLLEAGVDAILDDRGERPGAMFADWELIGVPHRVVLSDRGLKNGEVEYQGRRDAAAAVLPLGEAFSRVEAKLKA